MTTSGWRPWIRWYVKKATRYGLAVVAYGSGYLALDRSSGPKPRVRVLTYHRFRPCRRDPFSVDADRFEEQIRWLAEERLAVSLSDLADFLAGRRRLRDGAVLVTIDDGFEEIWSVAVPILRRYGVPAVAFVPTADVLESDAAARSDMASSGDGRLSPTELTSLADASVDLGSHSWQHRSLGRMGPGEVTAQLTRSRRDLEALLGRPIEAFAYPYGTWRDFNATTTRLLGETGYRLGFTSQHGLITSNADPLTLPRIKVEGGESLWMFKLLVAGALDSWRLVDRSFWWLQQRGTLTQSWAAGRKPRTGAI